MFSDNYSTEPLFSYANGYCSVFPKGLEKRFKVGDGALIIEDDYIIVVRNDTPESIKLRFIKEYAEYHRKKREEQLSGIYKD